MTDETNKTTGIPEEVTRWCQENGMSLVPTDQLDDLMAGYSELSEDMTNIIRFTNDIIRFFCDDKGKFSTGKLMGFVSKAAIKMSNPLSQLTKSGKQDLMPGIDLSSITPIIQKYGNQETETEPGQPAVSDRSADNGTDTGNT